MEPAAPPKEFDLFGFMTEEKAKELGFTHHGSYFGVPIYIGDPYGQCMVTTKHPLLDPLFDLMSVFEGVFDHSFIQRTPQPSSSE